MKKSHYLVELGFLLGLSIFLSCSKDGLVSEGFPLEKSDSIMFSLKNIIESYEGTSLSDFVEEVKNLDYIKNADINDSLVYITTATGGTVCVDLLGSSFRVDDDKKYSIDTCGTYIMNCIKEIEKQYSDSIYDGVQYEPIDEDSIDYNYGNEDDLTNTRATLYHRRILHKKRMAIWEPWNNFAEYDTQPFLDIVQNYKFDHEIINDFSPSAFKSFSQYDLVYIGSHGAKDGSILIPIDYESLYCDKYKYTKGEKTYINESEMTKDGISYHYSRKYFGLVKDQLWALKLDKKFLDKNLPDLSNTIICTSMCYAGCKNSQFVQSAIKNGCPEFYGADDPVEGSGVGPMSFFKNFMLLFSSGSSANLAYNVGIKSMQKTNAKYNYLRYGNTNVTYLIPFVTGVRDVSEETATLGVKFQYSLDIPGSDNSETPNQYGLLLTNLDNNTETYYPLSNINVQNSSIIPVFNYYNALFANIYIDKLDKNTNYKYRSYVIVGNKRKLSETTGSFKTTTRIEQVVPENLRKEVESYIPIYEGNKPPKMEGVYVIDPVEIVYDSTDGYKVGYNKFAPLYIRLSNQDDAKNTIDFESCQVSKKEGGSSITKGTGAFISGDGDKFTVFFKSTSVGQYSDYNVTTKESLVISGIKTDSGIKDIRYSFIIREKSDDPQKHVMAAGGFRVFKDGDNLSKYTQWPIYTRAGFVDNTNEMYQSDFVTHNKE